MAFVIDCFNNVSSGTGSNFTLWSYKNTDDTLAEITASGYFNPARFRLQEDDIIWVVASDGNEQLVVTSIIEATTVTTDVYIPSSGGAPADGTYITQTASGDLPNEQALSTLGTGALWNTTGTGVLSIDAALTSVGNLTTAADKMIYTTASDTYATTDLTAAARTLLDDASTAAMLTTLGAQEDLSGATIGVATVAGADKILIQDADDSDNLKYVLASTIATVSGAAPNSATYITQTASGDLTNEQALDALATGIVKNTTGTGVLSIAAEGTDYYGPGGTDVAVGDGGTGASDAATARSNLSAQEDLSGLAITGATVATGDKVVIQDIDDGDNLKTVTAQSIAELAYPVNYGDLGSDILPTSYEFAIGCNADSPSVSVTSDGATVTLSYEKSGGGDMEVFFSGGPVTVDCTPALTVALTAGTDVAPTQNYVYILKSAPTVLTKSTSGFPTGVEYVAVGEFLCPSAATVQTYGLYAGHVWNNEMWNGSSAGHFQEIGEWIRNQPASWKDGTALTPTLTPGTPDTLTFAISTGTSYQFHTHTFPAFDSSGGGSTNLTTFFVVNDNAAAYNPGKDLYNFLLDDAGNSAQNNDRISWVVWVVVSEESGDCKVMVNLPSGFYGNDADAIADPSRYSNFSIPADYQGTAFLVAKLTYQYQTSGGGDLTLVEQVDLRGLQPNVTAGGGAVSGATVELDNLSSVAINTSLISDTDVTDDLGSLAIRWNNIYGANLSSGDTPTDTLTISGYDTDGGGNTPFITITSNPTPTAVLNGDITSTTQAPSTNNTTLATTAYADAAVAAAASSYATTALDNLSSVAINTSLISDTDITDDLGSLGIRWNNIYGANLSSGDTATDTLTISAYDTDGGGNTPFFTLTSANTPTAVLSGDVTGTTQSANDNSTKLATTAYADAAAAAAGGAWTKLGQVTPSAAATADFDNLLDGTYKTYVLVLEEVLNATNNITLRALVGTGATPTYQTTTYVNNAWTIAGNGTTISNAGANTADMNISALGVSNAGTSPGLSGLIYVHDPASTSTGTRINTMCNSDNNTDVPATHRGGGMWNSTTAVTSFRLQWSSGNITSGTITLYGISTA